MSAPVKPVELTDAERRLLRNALTTYLSDFGHEDHELIVATKRLIAKLDGLDAGGTMFGTTKAAG